MRRSKNANKTASPFSQLALMAQIAAAALCGFRAATSQNFINSADTNIVAV